MRARLGRLLVGVLALGTVATTTAAAAHTDPYAPPGPLPPLSASTLTQRYAGTRTDIRKALVTARRLGDAGRIRSLSAMLAPGRTFLSFDARGTGRAVEVIGDLTTAQRIAVVVPGADGDLGNYGSWKFVGGGARAVYDQARRTDPGTRLAVVAWLGYNPPSTLSTAILTDGRARHAAPLLRTLVTGLRRTDPAAPIGLLCHSYGTVVCAEAAHGLPISALALYGSPGTTFSSVKGLRTHATVWAGRKSGDWTGWVPSVRFLGIGFGADPTSEGFGAHRFDAGSGAHSEYLKPGTRSLAALTMIALGRNPETTRG
jgi:hypothetical protein